MCTLVGMPIECIKISFVKLHVKRRFGRLNLRRQEIIKSQGNTLWETYLNISSSGYSPVEEFCYKSNEPSCLRKTLVQ